MYYWSLNDIHVIVTIKLFVLHFIPAHVLSGHKVGSVYNEIVENVKYFTRLQKIIFYFNEAKDYKRCN